MPRIRRAESTQRREPQLLDCRKLSCAHIPRVDQLNAIRPWSHVEASGLAEIKEPRPGIVQQGEDPNRAIGGNQVEIRHAASKQRLPFAKIVMNGPPPNCPSVPTHVQSLGRANTTIWNAPSGNASFVRRDQKKSTSTTRAASHWPGLSLNISACQKSLTTNHNLFEARSQWAVSNDSWRLTAEGKEYVRFW
jgi:hypothetical protein